jgi:hypothetical protein
MSLFLAIKTISVSSKRVLIVFYFLQARYIPKEFIKGPVAKPSGFNHLPTSLER